MLVTSTDSLIRRLLPSQACTTTCRDTMRVPHASRCFGVTLCLNQGFHGCSYCSKLQVGTRRERKRRSTLRKRFLGSVRFGQDCDKRPCMSSVNFGSRPPSGRRVFRKVRFATTGGNHSRRLLMGCMHLTPSSLFRAGRCSNLCDRWWVPSVERGGPSTVKKSVGWPRAGDQVVPALRWGKTSTPWQPGTELSAPSVRRIPFRWGSGQALPPAATTSTYA